MNTLFILDEQNYSDSWPVYEKYAVRAIICRGGKYAMQRGKKGSYKIPASIKEIGEVTELREDLHKKEQKYICHSLFYCCEVEETVQETHMTEKEREMGFRLEWATLEEIIENNSRLESCSGPERDTEFLKWWKKNGYR